MQLTVLLEEDPPIGALNHDYVGLILMQEVCCAFCRSAYVSACSSWCFANNPTRLVPCTVKNDWQQLYMPCLVGFILVTVYQKQHKLSSLVRMRHSAGECIAIDAYSMGESPW
ncbi:hypothetical protein KIW84_065869 [Lathyrus oleraceus]|uniref:Uncharacterized protein n=1 Tax=Pisum sativum TaxID=3888 RepID=A0A9D5AAD0_PEA|nr:hypothetical protein KIW84_065869 [Pisum sativum]